MPTRSTAVPPLVPSGGTAGSPDHASSALTTRQLPTSAELYAWVSELTLRANLGEAEAVLTELDAVLDVARQIGARRIVHRAVHLLAICNLLLDRLNDCVRACDVLAADLSDDPIDRGWLSSCASMRALVGISRGDLTRALQEMVEAAIQVRNAPTRGPGYLNAVNGLGVGCLSLRLYELALEQYASVDDDAVFAQYRNSMLFGNLNAQLTHIYWGLELDRVGSTTAASTHFERAMDRGRRALEYVPKQNENPWELVLEARGGMCLAFLGEADLAIINLEDVVPRLAELPKDETVMARIGLARASSKIDRGVARAHADLALGALDNQTDYALSTAASWERARLDLDGPATAAAADYCNLIARASWDERCRLVGSVAERIRAEVALRRAREIDHLLHDETTGLPNRLLLVQQLATYVAEARRIEGVVSLAFLDLSASAPHEVLHEIIATLDVDFLARYDHGELAAVGVGLGGAELADRVRACSPGAIIHLTVGVAALASPSSVTTLVAHADEALLTARRRGGIWINPHASAQ